LSLPAGSNITGLGSIAFDDSQNGYLAGSTSHLVERGSGKYAIGSEILGTSDGGQIWTVCYTDAKYDKISRIVITSGSTAIALADSSAILKTEDNGKNWKEIALDIPASDISWSSDGRL
jgi:photosystem II stability/assembly factor-like uncharacterized protein